MELRKNWVCKEVFLDILLRPLIVKESKTVQVWRVKISSNWKSKKQCCLSLISTGRQTQIKSAAKLITLPHPRSYRSCKLPHRAHFEWLQRPPQWCLRSALLISLITGHRQLLCHIYLKTAPNPLSFLASLKSSLKTKANLRFLQNPSEGTKPNTRRVPPPSLTTFHLPLKFLPWMEGK